MASLRSQSDPPDDEACAGRVPDASGGCTAATAVRAAALLRALTQLAASSPRREADLAAAVRRARLTADPAQVQAAVRLLQAQGCVANLIPLANGDLRLTVTGARLPEPT